MTYIIKHFDVPLLELEVIENTSSPVVHILWVTDDYLHLLPLDLKATEEGVSRWIKYRIIPEDRTYADNFLARCGLNANRPMDVISMCKGLSLNDSYWVVSKDFQGTFDQYNLYENKFSQTLAWTALTGYESSIRTSLLSSPEFTTNGMLPKCWRRISGKIYLYKGGTTGFANSGKEPYSEYYAAGIAKTMGVNAIDYRLSRWKGEFCSTCELFTDKYHAYMPVGKIVTSGGMKAVRAYYESLGQEYVDALNEMIVLDAIICNTDRHFGNFGFIVDSRTNQIVKPAPLFDHGYSLCNFAFGDDLASLDNLEAYANTLLPCVYDDFIEEARRYMTDKNRQQVRHLLTYKIQKNPRYNLDGKRLKLIEQLVQKRAKILLG